jgi:ankyrin repeat protein
LAAKFLEPEILRALKQGGADTEITMPNGATPLMLAAGMGSSPIANRRGVRVVDFGKLEPESRALETVSTVLSLGADLNAANRAGDTALHSAAALGYATVVTFLVEHGADVNARNRQGATPLGSLLASAKGRRGAAADPDGSQDGANSSNSPTVALLRKLGGVP